VEESVYDRDSIIRMSIDSQLALVNKLTEMRDFGRSSERPLGYLARSQNDPGFLEILQSAKGGMSMYKKH
jgi:hypothetical protein